MISPPTGFNRLAFGDRFGDVFPSHDPAYYSRLALGFQRHGENEVGHVDASSSATKRMVDFSIDYGLPGKPGYTYKRPFDYFNFQATASSANGFENVHHARPADRQGLRSRDRLSRRLGPLRQLRLHRAADLPGLEHRALARHDRRSGG